MFFALGLQIGATPAWDDETAGKLIETDKLLAMQSPAFVDNHIYEGYQAVDRLPFRVFLSTGYPWDVDARTLKRILEHKSYPLKYLEVPEGHSWGQWRAQLDDLLIYFFKPEP